MAQSNCSVYDKLFTTGPRDRKCSGSLFRWGLAGWLPDNPEFGVHTLHQIQLPSFSGGCDFVPAACSLVFYFPFLLFFLRHHRSMAIDASYGRGLIEEYHFSLNFALQRMALRATHIFVPSR